MPDTSSHKAVLTRAEKPFRFYYQLDLRELTGLKARHIKDLLEHLKHVPGSVVYYHTHRFLQQHQYLAPEPPNDFAYWVREMLGLSALGERLASVDIHEFTTIAEIRQAIIEVLEDGAQDPDAGREAPAGKEFHFVKSVSFVFPTPYEAYDLRQFADGLRKITVESLYYHMFSAKLRLERGGRNDFSFWMETSLGETKLAEKIAKLDPYTHTMEQLRAGILRLVEVRTGRN